MENTKEYFEPKNFRVPIDSTWQIETTMDVNANNDTSWLLTAEKLFNSVEEINEAYINETGENRRMQRKASFSKSFKWFTTVFRYSESVDKVMDISCPMSDFLTNDELKYIYYPEGPLSFTAAFLISACPLSKLIAANSKHFNRIFPYTQFDNLLGILLSLDYKVHSEFSSDFGFPGGYYCNKRQNGWADIG